MVGKKVVPIELAEAKIKAARAERGVIPKACCGTRDQARHYAAPTRHALAHRIPVYIPPGMVPQRNVDAYNELTIKLTDALNQMRPFDYQRLSSEQSKLLVFQPMIAHSTVETKALMSSILK